MYRFQVLTILQCLYSECWTVWSNTSIIDCCRLHRVAGEWSQSSQHILSAPLSCNVHNGGTIAVAQSVSSDHGTSWCGQGTLSHTRLSDLFSTDVLLSLGALVGAGEETCIICGSCTEVRYHLCFVPVVKMLVEEVSVLLMLLLLTITAVTLTVQLTPGREEMV